jgi:hypothetical protein
MLVMVSAVPPVLVRVMFWGELSVFRAWLPKVRLDGERLTAGMLTPVPVRTAGTGDTAGEVKLTFTVPVKVPVAAGVKVALIVQVPLGATVVQLLVWEKSAAFAP